MLVAAFLPNSGRHALPAMRTHLSMNGSFEALRPAARLAGGLVVLACFALVAGCAPEEVYEPTPTDIYLARISTNGDRVEIGPPRNLTDRDGYDNQPAFTEDGRMLLFASARSGSVDIYGYDLVTDELRQLTDTPEREYSPSPVPEYLGFSTVRVETDGSQRLWQFDPSGRDPVLLLEWEDDVGYYAWIDPDVVALRLEDEPTELRFADVDSGWVERESVMTDVGRSLHRVPGKNAISFVHTDPEGEWWITELDLMLREQTRLVPTLEGSEDYAWTPTGDLLMAQGSKLFRWRRDVDETWAEIADFAAGGLDHITRLAVSPDGTQLALVARRPGSPEDTVDEP